MTTINTIPTPTPTMPAALTTYEWRGTAVTTPVGGFNATHGFGISVVPAATSVDSAVRMDARLDSAAARSDKQVAKQDRPPRGRTP